MLQKTMCAISVTIICLHISAAQTSNFKTDNSFPSGIGGLNSDDPTPEAVESFVRTSTSAIFSSAVLSDIFDLSQFPAETVTTHVHDHAYADFVRLGHSDPGTLAKPALTPLGTGADAFTLPITVSILANTAGRHLFENDILNPDNAVSLAMKYANFMEESAKGSWIKDRPESKFPAFLDGFIGFLSSLEDFTVEKAAEVAFHYGMEVKNAGKNIMSNFSL